MRLLEDENLSGRVADRSSDHLTPDRQADLVIATIERIDEDLVAGAVASVTPRRIRVRPLPMSSL